MNTLEASWGLNPVQGMDTDNSRDQIIKLPIGRWPAVPHRDAISDQVAHSAGRINPKANCMAVLVILITFGMHW